MHKREDWDGEIGEGFVRVGRLTMKHPHHVEFVIACRDAGFQPYEYEGRFCYVGPGVTLPDLSEMGRLGTDIPLAWDNLGKDFVVHPSKSTNESDIDRIKAMQFLYKLRREASGY